MRRYLMLLIFLDGCRADLSLPAGELLFYCASQRDCPDDLVCATAVGRCVEPGTDTSFPAVVGSIIVTPTLVRSGVPIQISFTVNKNLVDIPTVDVTVNGTTTTTRNASFVDVDATGRSYQFSFTPEQGTDPEGAVSLRIQIRDSLDNLGEAILAGAATIDYTPPTIVAGTLVVNLLSAIDSARSDITALKNGARVALSFITSELLDPTSLVTIATTPRLEATLDVSSGLSQAYSYSVGPADPNGVYAVELQAIDLAGNEQTIFLTDIVIDTVAPSDPTVNTSNNIVYRRIPWGAHGIAKQFTVVGQSNAVESNASVLVYDDAFPPTKLATTSADTNGAFGPVLLPPLDFSNVQVQTVDAAGNASALLLVRDGEWVATLKGKSAAGFDTNPHSISANVVSEDLREPHTTRSLSQTELDSLDATDGVYTAISAERHWAKRQTTTLPQGRFLHAAFYDSVRAEMIIFGGATDPYSLSPIQDAWRWNGVDFETLTTSGPQPTARFGHAMTYDRRREVGILFGGRGPSGMLDDQWAWNGEEWLAVNLQGVPHPTPRYLHQMAYDDTRHVIVLFGGCSQLDCQAMYHDTWEWDGSTWRDVSPPFAFGAQPPGRVAAAMAYQTQSDGVVLHAGCDENNYLNLTDLYCDHGGNPDADTWVWTGTQWINKTTGSEPPQRAFAQMVNVEGDLIMFGGCTFGSPGGTDGCVQSLGSFGSDQVWCWDGDSWSVADLGLDFQAGFSAVYENSKQRVTLFGGFVGADFGPEIRDDFQHWAGDCGGGAVRIASSSLSATPPARDQATLTYDPIGDRAVLFGGGPTAGADPTFVFSDPIWLDPFYAGEPGGRIGAGAAFDEARDRLVIFGGGAGAGSLETWEWNPLAGGSWSQVCTTVGCRGSLTARMFHAQAYDASVGQERVVIFGGTPSTNSSTHYNDLYQYNGSAWTQLCTGICPKPPARRCAAITYDDARDRLVLVGGRNDPNECFQQTSAANLLDDTWEWNGTSWTKVCGSGVIGCTNPPARSGHNMIYDSVRKRSVLFGGGYDDVWEWDGASWQNLTAAALLPDTRFASSATYDFVAKRALLYGGRSGLGRIDDLWELNLDAALRSSLSVAFDWTSSQVPLTQIQAVSLVAQAGASGANIDTIPGADNNIIGDVLPGVALDIWSWQSGTWSNAATQSFLASSPGSIVFNDPTPSSAQQRVVPAKQKIYLRLVPTNGSGNGPTPAQVSLDYIELTVRYRRP